MIRKGGILPDANGDEPGIEVIDCDLEGCSVLTLRGELISSQTVESLHRLIHQHLHDNPGSRIVLDLHRLEFASSGAVMMLARLVKFAESVGSVLVLADAGLQLKKTLKMMGTIPGLKVFETVDDAIEGFSA